MTSVPEQIELNDVVLSIRFHFAQIDLVFADCETNRHIRAYLHLADIVWTTERVVAELLVVSR